MKNKNIMLLCKVVDNFGDIGVVYRLAKSLTDADSTLNLTIVCSDLKSFSMMAKNVDARKKVQTIKYGTKEWTVLDWNQNEDFFYNSSPFPVILECFQCGRPDWLEKILFAENPGQTFHIFNIEYLTAESWADDFHLLKSYTRSSFVKKMFFMPGFTSKTGGLIIDSGFKKLLDERKKSNPSALTVTMFSYERDFSGIFKVLKKFEDKIKTRKPDFKVKVLAAAGRSLECVKEGWRKNGCKIELTELDFLAQEEWDRVLMSADFNFIRGEESLARACLSGIPFIWHAYVQDDNNQLVKVNALLERITAFAEEKKYADALNDLWNQYNTPDAALDEDKLLFLFEEALRQKQTKKSCFTDFSESLLKNGNLAENLLTFMQLEKM
jgi:uncharacterized repeat protein (TIGR03837 family)